MVLTETVSSWWRVFEDISSPHRMEALGLQGLLEQQVLSMMLLTVTVNSRQLVMVELPLPPQTEHPGLLKLLELLPILKDLPMETVCGL